MTTFIERPVLAEEDIFPGLAEMLEDFLTPQIEAAADPLYPEQMIGMFIERLALDMPLELQMQRDENNRMALGCSPPTQWLETSVQPVLHRLRLTLERDDDESRQQGVES